MVIPMTVDQSVVDEILAKAAEDTEEGRLEKLEKEVETLKGSIKRLLLDLRETMNRLENPFANLQSLAEANIVPQSAPQIQIVPTSIPEPEKKEEKEEKAQEVEEKSQEKKEEEQKVEEKTESGEKMEDLGFKEAEKVDKVELDKDALVQPAKTLTETKEERSEVIDLFKGTKGRMDFMTLFNLMEWVHSMVSKHSYDAFKLMLEVFEMTGYINSNTKDLIMKLADLVKINGTKEVLIELYLLNKVFNPNDRSMDSDLLSLLLKKR